LRRKWTLRQGIRPWALAEPEGFFGSGHRVALRGSGGGGLRTLRLAPDGMFKGGSSLKRGQRTLARLQSRGVFNIGQRIEAEPDVPLELLVFVGLVALSANEKRRQGTAGDAKF
ncbi:MAG: hypothetical protein AAFZ65_20155, partial [Planctomycetota bacterium]